MRENRSLAMRSISWDINKSGTALSYGGSVGQAWVRGLLRRLARKSGVEKRVHAHGFRHTHATELVREGQSLAVIQAQLGHKSPITTSRYLHRLAPQALIEAIRRRPAWVSE